MSYFKAKMNQIQFRRRLQRSPRPPSWIKGAYFYGEGRGKGGEKGREGTEREGEGWRREGEGRGRDPTPTRPQSIFLDTPLAARKT